MMEDERPRVALIGCGASGMLFLNALVTKQKERGDMMMLPYVTCFERATEPGGCWRCPPPEERHYPHNLSCWYPDVWSNVCKEGFEFADYTFWDHFGKEVPSFLPRQHLLDYLIKRTTRVDPDLLQSKKKHNLHEIRYETVVTSVVFDKERSVFVVGSSPWDPSQEKNVPTKEEEFDYCIWAGGLRGKPRIPRLILEVLRRGRSPLDNNREDAGEQDEQPAVPFTGTILHSIQAPMPRFMEAVKGKQIVLIGDSSSAEDLSLQCVKWGAEMVYILSRSGYGDCMYMGSWPGTLRDGTNHPRVKTHIALPYRVVGDGSTIVCYPTGWNHDREVYEFNDDTDPIVLKNIDSVVFCTGYIPEYDALSRDLRLSSEDLYTWFWRVPSDFVMADNPFAEEVGHVPPSKDLSLSGNIVPGVYRTVLVSNPRMMFILADSTEIPILHLEALAWLCLAFITREAEIPSAKEMEKQIQSQMMDEMNIAYLRWTMDRNYFEALEHLGDDHWSDNLMDPRATELEYQFSEYFVRIIARDLKEANYPIDFGSYDELNETGKKLAWLSVENSRIRDFKTPAQEAHWRTFRDVDPSPFKSIFTGKGSKALPKPWLEMAPSDDAVI